MNRYFLSLFCLLFLSMLSNASGSSHPETVERLTYASYNTDANRWTNVTIEGKNYKINSNFGLIDGLESQLINDPWDQLSFQIKETNFFKTSINDSNPTLILKIEYDGNSNQIALNQSTNYNSILLNTANLLFQRITGWSSEEAMWPVDLQVMVLESYPEQYAINVLFQRYNDKLMYVEEQNATLIVSNYDIYANDTNGTIIYTDIEIAAIASGGATSILSFNTFSVGTDYSPSVLYFFVVLENELFIFSSPTSIGGGISTPDLIIDTFNTSDSISLNDVVDSSALELPFGWQSFAISLISLLYIKKKIK